MHPWQSVFLCVDEDLGNVALFAVVEHTVPVAVFPQQADGVPVGNGRNHRIVQSRAAAEV